MVIDPFDHPWRPSSDLDGAYPDQRATTDRFEETTPAGRASPADVPLDFLDEVARFERGLLERALDASRHNQKETARALGLGYHQLRRLLKETRSGLSTDVSRGNRSGGP